jgi:hypothetical protein
MVRRPKSSLNQSDSDLHVEETLTIDHPRWSGFRDGVGEREDGVDEQGFSIELLRLRKEFSSFALPLTDRILRLIDFDRPGATRALRVDQDETSPRLVLVSERASGFRLSELLERGAERGVIPDLGAALYIMRRLLATAAAIQRDTGVCHLAISPERILITPRGSVVIVEAAMAGAIEAFGDRIPPAVRKAMRVARLEAATNGPQVDIARITIAGMALIVGRPLDPAEEIDPLSPVVQEVVEVAAVRAGDLFAAALTPWIDRAISVDPLLAFGDYADAVADLDEIVPPAEARCSISRATLRKFMDDLSLDRAHLAALEADRIREIRARQVRHGLAAPTSFDAAPPEATASDVLHDPAAAIMDMPIAVEDLSTEILNQPVVIDDQPSAMAAVIEQAMPAVDEEPFRFDLTDGQDERPAEITFPPSIEFHDERATEPPDELLAEIPNQLSTEIADELPVEISDDLQIEISDDVSVELTEAIAAEMPGDEAPVAVSDEVLAEISDLVSFENELLNTPGPDEPLSSDPSLDDLVDEILRRSAESDVTDLPSEEEYVAAASEEYVADLTDVSDAPETAEEVIDPYSASAFVESEPFVNSPVAEVPADEPPVDEPPVDEPPVDEPHTEEPPAEEPPPYEPPVQDPPPDDPPADEPPPLWLRAAIEQVARSRQERPAPTPPRHVEMKGPVFQLHDEPEPERELEPETTTLSDIAKELGLTIQVAEMKPAIVAEPPAAPPPAPAAFDEPASVFDPPPPVFGTPVEAAEIFTPLPPQVIPYPPTEVEEEIGPAPVAEAPPPPPAVPRPSIAERTAEFRESMGRYGKVAATLVLVVGGLGAAAYGGWRYYSTLTAPGTLVVESTPPGAQVEIDGTQRGTTPVTLELPPGGHELALTRRGITRRFTVAVRPGEETTQALDWSQVRETGSLAVTTDPVGAKVSVDGKFVGVTPLTVPDLTAGRRRVVLEGAGGTVRREITIEADKTATISEAIFSGFLAVFAPVELQIFEGNRLIGTTENSRIMIPAGRHELTLVNRELGSRLTRTVDVEPGQVAAINITEVPAAAKPAAAPQPATEAVQPAADQAAVPQQ